MPGLFGAFNCHSKYYESLRERFSALFGSCEWKQFRNGMLGGHAFGGRSALGEAAKNCWFVVDGEGSVYRHARKSADQRGTHLFRFEKGDLSTTALCKGNIAVLDETRQMLFLAAEWSGIFPLYYTQSDDGILFCSHCKPLAEVIGASADYVGVIEYMVWAYFVGNRTSLQKIHRLLPGQVLTYSLRGKSFSLEERSRYWTGAPDGGSGESDAGQIWQTFQQACHRCFDSSEVHGVMLSAGWDSRLVLAGLLDVVPASRTWSITHGDAKSREFRLTRAISRSGAVRHFEVPVHDHLRDLDQIKRIFPRCEAAMYPFWHWSTQRLAAAGVRCASAGVMGEVFGGHFGRGAVQGPWGNVKYFASHAFLPKRQTRMSPEDDFREVVGLINSGYGRKPWYLRKDFWRSLPNLKEVIRHDINAELKRYEQRGVPTPDQLFEAYLAEHTAAQWWAKQILTARGTMDIALPLADRDFMMLAAQIPMREKIHNRLNRRTLRAFAPNLVKHPTAAILVPANFPIIVQEATRLIRWTLERIGSDLYFRSRGKIEPPRMEWRNFPALRDGAALVRLVDDMRLELLDKDAIQTRIDDMVKFRKRISLGNLAHQLLRIYTMDLMLR